MLLYKIGTEYVDIEYETATATEQAIVRDAASNVLDFKRNFASKGGFLELVKNRIRLLETTKDSFGSQPSSESTTNSLDLLASCCKISSEFIRVVLSHPRFDVIMSHMVDFPLNDVNGSPFAKTSVEDVFMLIDECLLRTYVSDRGAGRVINN